MKMILIHHEPFLLFFIIYPRVYNLQKIGLNHIKTTFILGYYIKLTMTEKKINLITINEETLRKIRSVGNLNSSEECVILDLIYSANPGGIVSHGLIKQAISEELNADPRTAENYFLCIKGFAEQMMKEELGYYSTWNLRGLHEAIGEKLQMRYSKQNNLGMENAQ